MSTLKTELVCSKIVSFLLKEILLIFKSYGAFFYLTNFTVCSDHFTNLKDELPSSIHGNNLVMIVPLYEYME